MRRFVFCIVFLMTSLVMSAQKLSVSWLPDMSSQVYSNCGNVTVKVTVSNGTSVDIDNYTIDCFVVGDGRDRPLGYESEAPLAAGASNDVVVVNQGLNPGRYLLKVVVHDSTDTIYANIDVVYCVDVAVVNIVSPITDATFVEGEPVVVESKFKNLGARAANGVNWVVTNVDGNPVLPAQSLSSMNHGDVISDSQAITLPMGYIGQQKLKVNLGLANDQHTNDNSDSVSINVLPAYNLKAVKVESAVEGRCRMTQVPISITMRNDGAKSILATDSLLIGYDAILLTSGVSVSTLPLHHHEVYHPSADWHPGDTIVATFLTPANLYPTGALADISVSLSAWCKHEYDIVSHGDTTDAITIRSLHSPDVPAAADLNIPYATRSIITASQSEQRPIRWYADSTLSPFFAVNSYSSSTSWGTPQYFADTVYYLMSVGVNGCSSYYAPVHVNLMDRWPYDAGVSAVLSPSPKMVYTEVDTVRVTVCNYGTEPVSHFSVGFSAFDASGYMVSNIKEDMPATLLPDQCLDYTFNSLLVIPHNAVNRRNAYSLKAWTSLDGDYVNVNDTIFDDYYFTTLPESDYCTPSVSTPASMDIVSVHLNTLANELSPIGRSYLNMGLYDTAQRLVPALHLSRGTADTLVVAIANPTNLNDTLTKCMLLVAVDFNRDASFDNETLHLVELMAGDTVALPFVVPDTACFGYMKLRLLLSESTTGSFTPCMAVRRGQVQDYLLFIDEKPLTVDLAATRFVSPSSPFVDTTAVGISFAIANRGARVITQANVDYTYHFSDTLPPFSGSFSWNGSLAPGATENVSLPPYLFPEGTTDVTIAVSTTLDALRSNDTLRRQLHRFHTVRCLYTDNFDDSLSLDYWYAPYGQYLFNRNLWQLGMPSSQVINTTRSGDNAWVTLLDTNVVTGVEGNMSVLYSPLFDVSISHPDTFSIYLQRNMSACSLIVEYLDANGAWKNLYSSSSVNWYNNASGFSGNSDGYQQRYITMPFVQSSLGNVTQFRFIYRVTTSTSSVNHLDGVALDNVRITHARGAIDVGAKLVALATDPQLRRKVYPQVVVYNFGTDTVCDIPLCYKPWGDTSSVVVDTFYGCIPPAASDTFVFATPFTVQIFFPDDFHISAATLLHSDIYMENDSCRNIFHIVPTDDDLELCSFISPRYNEVASDTVEVTLRLCNNGSYPIASIPIALNYNNQYEVVDDVDFVALLGNDGLPGHQCYNYTFLSPYHISIGTTTLSAHATIPYDINTSNDTLEAFFFGLTNSTDLEAVDILLDTSIANNVRVQLTVRNAGARVVRSFTAGFYIDGDTSTLFSVPYRGNPIAALDYEYILFNYSLPARPEGYSQITAFVHIDDDIDPYNDTTSLIVEPYVDLVAKRLILQDNQLPDCKVRLRVANQGNYTAYQPFFITAVVNGVTIMQDVSQMILPGTSSDFEFDSLIAKNPDGKYSGTGVIYSAEDSNPNNNQTSFLQVVSSFNGIDVVDLQTSSLAISAPYPNPCRAYVTLPFATSQSQHLTLQLFDHSGRLLYSHSAVYEAGSHLATIRTSHLPSGIYYCLLQSDVQSHVAKIVVR